MSQQTHYDILGVSPSATDDEIKRAFRAKAADAHPDKGGDHLTMSLLNLAYETLTDPQRRLLYDRTGESAPRPADEQVRGFLMLAFNDAIQKDAVDVLAHVKQCLTSARDQLQQQQRDQQSKLERLQQRRDKIKVSRNSINAFHLVVDQQIIQLQQNVAKMEMDLKNYKAVEKELKKYKSEEEAVQRSGIHYANVYFDQFSTAAST